MKQRWNSQRRRFSRGVAMVEGGILAPIFAMMMMLTVYLGGIYQTKYKTFMQARFNGWSYVSSACTSGSGDQSEAASNQFDTPPQTTQAQGAQAPGRSAAESKMFIGHGQSQLTWDYEPTYKFNNGPKTITTETWAVCNEPPPQGMNLISEAGNIISQVNP